MRMDKGKPFLDVPADGAPDGYEGKRVPPVFSEEFLYPTVGKGDARFILGIAEEYAHVVDALGPKAMRVLLNVKPRLAQRLGLPKVVIKCLKDALSDEAKLREKRLPSQVILDSDAAHDVWGILHNEYRTHYDPEETMDRGALRAYNTLTDALGRWEKDERQKERDKLPEKLKQKAAREKQLEVRKANRNARKDAVRAVFNQYEKLVPERDWDLLAGEVERVLRGVKDAV